MKSALFIQIQQSTLTALDLRRNKRGWRPHRDYQLSAAAREEADSEPVDWGTLLRAKSGEKAPAGIPCVLVLHRKDYALLRLELPQGSQGETASMLELELGERIPVDLERICYGWECLGAAEDGRQIVQVYWTPQEKILPLHESLGRAGYLLAGAFPSFAIYQRVFQITRQKHPAVLLLQSTTGYEYAEWGPAGEALFSRGGLWTNGARQDSAQRAPIAAAELVRCFQSAAHSQPAADLRHLITFHHGPGHPAPPFTADETPNPGMQSITERLKGMEPEAAADFIPIAAAAELADTLLDFTPSGNLRATFNMLPHRITKGNDHSFQHKMAIQAVAVLVGLLLLIAGNVWLYQRQMNLQLERNQAEIVRLNPQVKDVEAMEERIASIRSQIDYAIAPTEALKVINAVLAKAIDTLDGLYLDHMTYLANGEIGMEGHAVNDITPWRLAEELNKTGLFRILHNPKIDERMLGGARLIRFTLKVQALAQGAGAPRAAEAAGGRS